MTVEQELQMETRVFSGEFILQVRPLLAFFKKGAAEGMIKLLVSSIVQTARKQTDDCILMTARKSDLRIDDFCLVFSGCRNCDIE